MRHAWWCCVFVAAGCASGALDPQWATREHGLVQATAFTAGDDLVGFDAPSLEATLAAGDRILLGMSLQRGSDSTSRTFSLEVQSVERVRWPPSPEDQPMYLRVASVHLRVFDAAGSLLAEETIRVDAGDLESGVARACRGDDERDRSRARWALRELFGIIRESPILAAVMYEVIDPPSLWSILTHLGVELRTQVHFDEARPAEPFALGEIRVPAWSLPHEVRVNGQPALRSILQVADPVSPLALCAGIVSFTSVHPTDPSRVLKVRLLAARRGQG